jgi:pimeloyl-ACP methyl ester carboxylesterase
MRDDAPNLGRRTFLKCCRNVALLSLLNGCGVFQEQEQTPLNCAAAKCGYFDVGYGTMIYYEFTPARVGRKTRISCHGFSGTYQDYKLIEDREDFGVFTFSHAGHFPSGSYPPEIGNTLPTAVITLEKLLAHAKGRGMITGEDEVFVGFSMGSKILTNYFAKHPEDKRGAFLVNGQDIPCEIDTINLLNLSLFLQLLLNPSVDLRAKIEYVKSLGETDSSEDFCRCMNPTAIIGCGLDEIVPVTDMRAMAARKPNSRYYELAEERHMPSAEGIRKMNDVFYENVEFLMGR